MYYQRFDVVGGPNVTVLDAGLVSTVEEPKHIDAILIDVSAYQDNIVEGWIGNLRVAEVSDYVFCTRFDAGAANAFAATNKIVRLPIDLDIPAGQTFKVGVRSGAVANDITGSYEYTIKK